MAASAQDLATAYVSISLSTRGLGKDVSKELGDAGDAGGKVGGQKAGKSFLGSIGGILKKGVIATGVAAGALLATSLVKGWGRLTNIENATAKLTGLGNSAESVDSIMKNALASVKGTAFGLDEAATTAAGAVAAGIKPGKELEKTLKTVADAATIGGTSLGEMGAIFNKVATSNKIQGDVINQLNDKGIPIVQLLGKAMGKTSAEVTALASKGKVDFATFQKAMEDGVGGAALKSGATTAGAFKNMGAALGRFGATLAGPIFGGAGGVFGGITKSLDTLNDKAGPLVAKFAAKATAGLGKAVDWAKANGPKLWDAFKTNPTVVATMESFGRIWDTLKDTALKLWPSIKKIGSSLADASKSLGVSAWGALLAIAEAIAKAMQSALIPALDWVAKFMKKNPAAVIAFVAALTAWKLATMGISAATKIAAAAQAIFNAVMAINPVVAVIAAIAGLTAGFIYLWNHSEGFRNFWIGLWNGIKSVTSTAISAVLSVVQTVWNFIYDYIVTPVRTAWDFVFGLFTGAGTGISTAISAILLVVQTVWNFIYDYIVTPIRTAWDWVTARFNDVMTFLAPWFAGVALIAQTAWAKIYDYIITPIKKAWDWVSGAFDTVKTWIVEKIALIVAALKLDWDFIYDHIITPIKNAWQWVSDKFDSVKKWIVEKIGLIVAGLKVDWDFIYDHIITPIKNAWQWVSDKFDSVKKWIVEKIVDITKAFRAAWNWIREYIISPIKTAWQWVSDKFGIVAGWVGGAIDKVTGALKSAWDWTYDYIIGPIGRAIAWVKDALTDLKDWMAQQGSISASGTSLDPLVKMGIPLKAAGGPVSARSPYIVGEVGPELFVPSTSGTIVPNHQLSSGSSGASSSSDGAETNFLLRQVLGAIQRQPQQQADFAYMRNH